MQVALGRRADAVFLADAKSLVQAVNKGRSHNREYNLCCTLFATAREQGLSWKVQWVDTDNNDADLPTRPEKLPFGLTHPELVQPGVSCVVPAGWDSPNLYRVLKTGNMLFGEVVQPSEWSVPGIYLTCSNDV